MAPPLRVRLDQAAHDELERRYLTTRDATTRTRYQMILLRAEDHQVIEVAQLTRCSPDTVRRVLKRYLVSWSESRTWIPTRSGCQVRCGAVGCWPTTWPGSPGIGRGSRACGSRCTGPGLCASGPAGCCPA